ncbi:MAG: type IV pili methyl-accepting chemotaxis transducer N-terminal domain-containing protein [Sulfitobacter sp.]
MVCSALAGVYVVVQIQRLLAGIGVLWLLMAGAVGGQTITVSQNAVNKIKLADRQRLLSEQLGRSICLVMGHIDAASESDRARGSADLFDTTMRALRSGDENMGLLAETNVDVLAALDHVEEISVTYRAAALQVGAGDLHAVPIGQIMQLSDPLLHRSNEALAVIENTYGDVRNAKRVKTVELARRQTVLSQKLMKEICFVSLNINQGRMISSLAASLAEFERAQVLLEQGSLPDGVLHPTPRLAKKLAAVRGLWDEFALSAHKVAAGRNLTTAELEELVTLSNQLLFKCKQAARAYAKL